MALNSTHPSYDAHVKDWELMRDSYSGEGAVKAKGFVYLPATPAQVLDGALDQDPKKPGYVSYQGYLARAVFPDYVSDAVERYIGMLHDKDAEIELPPAMEPLREKATADGESLLNLLRRINEEQLVSGRLGLLLDFPPNPDPTAPMPYIAMYVAEAVRNWDSSSDHVGVNALTMVVLDESGPVRINEFEWKDTERYRVLQLGMPVPPAPAEGNSGDAGDENGNSTVPDDATEGVGSPVYMQGVFEMNEGGTSFDPAGMLMPVYRGVPLAQIPFVMVNSKDITSSPDNPPLIGLGRLCMTVYRGEADYRFTLFMQGQATLVTIGTVQQNGQTVVAGEDPLRVGAGAHINMDLNGDAKYIGVGAEGIDGQRLALLDDRKLAESKAGTMISPAAGKQESGDALTTRVAAQTASLTQIAQTGAAALQNILRIAAAWMGQDPEAVKVTPNLQFETQLVTAQEITQLMAARTMGAPLSLRSIHGVMRDRNLTQMDYEDELDLIAEEDLERAKRVATLPQPPAPPAPNKPPAPPAPKGGK
jgi:hypothetical protein